MTSSTDYNSLLQLLPCPLCGKPAEGTINSASSMSVQCTNLNCGCRVIRHYPDKFPQPVRKLANKNSKRLLNLLSLWTLLKCVKIWNKRQSKSPPQLIRYRHHFNHLARKLMG